MSNGGSFFVVTGCLATGYVCYHLPREWWKGRVVYVGEGVTVSTPVAEDVEAVVEEVVYVGEGVTVSTPVAEDVVAVVEEVVYVGEGVTVSTPVAEDVEAVVEEVVYVGEGVTVSTPVAEDVEGVVEEVVYVGEGVTVSTPVAEDVEAVVEEVVCVGEGVPVSTPVVEDLEAVVLEEVRVDVEQEERIAAWDRAEIAFMLDVMVEAVETSLEGTTGGHPTKIANTRRALSPICKSRKEWMAIWEEPKKKRFKGLRKLLNYLNCFRKKKQ